MTIIRKYRYVAAVVLFAAIAALAFPMVSGNSRNPSTYTFVTISKGNIESIISSSGTLNPVTEVMVGTQVSGTIDKVFADFNDKVRKGQIIAVLDPALLQMSVDNARADSLKAAAQWEEAQMNHKRSAQLFAKGMISESEYQMVKTALKTSEAGYLNACTARQRAVQSLHYSIIRAPIDGTVTARSVEAGQTVTANFATPTLFTIAQDLSKMEITASVDENDIGQIKAG